MLNDVIFLNSIEMDLVGKAFDLMTKNPKSIINFKHIRDALLVQLRTYYQQHGHSAPTEEACTALGVSPCFFRDNNLSRKIIIEN